jgi:LacI family transcriptional regulator
MPDRRAITINLEEVAKKAGVSASTVSRVLNNLNVVKTSTRTRVMRAIEELNYHPNLHARSLAHGRSRILGIIVSNMENPFFLDIYRTLESDAHSRGYQVVVANTAYDSEQLVASVQLMIGWRVAGLAAIVSEMDEDLVETLAASKIPIALYDVGTPKQNIAKVRVDYRKGIKKTVSYLNSLGHRHMAFVGHHSTLGPISERRKTFVEMVGRCSPGAENRIFGGADGLEGGREAARAFLKSGLKATAILCVNDFMAVGVLRELREQGIQVPRDISVTGFDNIKLAEFCSPALTTVHIPREQIGHIIFEGLVSEPQNAQAFPHETVIDPELVVRESTGVARKS